MVLKEYDEKIFPSESSLQEITPPTFEDVLSEYIGKIPQKWILKSFELWEYKIISGQKRWKIKTRFLKPGLTLIDKLIFCCEFFFKSGRLTHSIT